MLEEALEGSPEGWGGRGQHAFPGVSSERASLLFVCHPRASSSPQFLHPPCWPEKRLFPAAGITQGQGLGVGVTSGRRRCQAGSNSQEPGFLSFFFLDFFFFNSF